ncbi:MAG: site-specific integrase, partial [Candidatus Acidiferrales bacterium]
ELQRSTLLLLAQRRASEGDKNGSVGEAITDASGIERCLNRMEIAERTQRTWDFVFPSHRHKGKKPLDLAAVLKRKIQPAFAKVGVIGVGWHTFRHTVGTMLAEMGEHQLTIRDYLRHSNLHVTNKYLQATPERKRLAQGKLVDAILPGGLLSVNKSTVIQ